MGAFNDNLLKQAFGLLLIFDPALFGNKDLSQSKGTALLILAKLLFTIPFFLFSALAGQLADRYEKSQLAKIIKGFEVGLMLLATLGLLMGSVYLLLFVIFFLGLHSTIFGPIKYSLLPDHLGEDELVGGNALIEAGTFLSILLGTLVAAPLVQMENGPKCVSVVLLVCALIGLISSQRIPRAPVAEPNLEVNYNIINSTLEMMRYSYGNKNVFTAIVGISWFWVIGALLVTLFAPFAKQELGANQDVVSAFLAMLSIGIAIGSLLCNRLLKGEITARLVPISCVMMGVFILDLTLAGISLSRVEHQELYGLLEFLGTFNGFRVLFDLLGIAVSGGIYVVPLYAILQSGTEPSHRARVIASNNVINSLGILLAGVFLLSLQQLTSLSSSAIFGIFGIINFFICLGLIRLLPHESFRKMIRHTLSLTNRVKLNIEPHQTKAPREDAGTLVVCNHSSSIDTILIACFLPVRPILIVSRSQCQPWELRLLRKIVQVEIIDYHVPMTMKRIVNLLRAGSTCVMFPEGRLTATGTVMRVFEAPAMVAARAKANLKTVYIAGSDRTYFSILEGIVKRTLFPKITITVNNQDECYELPESREAMASRLYQAMTNTALMSSTSDRLLFEELWASAKQFGFHRIAVEDGDEKTTSYFKLLLQIAFLGPRLNKKLKNDHAVGILLPNIPANITSILATSWGGRVSVMLNYTLGKSNVIATGETAGIRRIVTSRKFLEVEELSDLLRELPGQFELIFLEDLSQERGFFSNIAALVRLPFLSYQSRRLCRGIQPTDPAVILFTSGSEGHPKGVALSHEALHSNRNQLKARLELTHKDRLFNALPMFHSFGLSVGVFLPLFTGMRCILYLSPLHYKRIPDLVYKTNTTIFLSTDTFLRGYGRVAHPYTFYRVRYIFAGAEKLSELTQALWMDRFGIRILEGYGATEAAPVISINTPLMHRRGSVGRILPGIEYRTEAIDGLKDGEVLYIRGPNLMNGYITADAPGVITPLPEGWYNTGDIVSIDSEGFLHIVGRAKRFAKVAGEMISLTAVEKLVEQIWPDDLHAVLSQRDPSRGESIVLFTTRATPDRSELIKGFREFGYREIAVPKTINSLKELPLLSTGKINYNQLKESLSHLNG